MSPELCSSDGAPASGRQACQETFKELSARALDSSAEVTMAPYSMDLPSARRARRWSGRSTLLKAG
jgi:hypothetical protein